MIDEYGVYVTHKKIKKQLDTRWLPSFVPLYDVSCCFILSRKEEEEVDKFVSADKNIHTYDQTLTHS